MMYEKIFRKMQKTAIEMHAFHEVLDTLFDTEMWRSATYQTALTELADRENEMQDHIAEIYESFVKYDLISDSATECKWALWFDGCRITEIEYSVEFVALFCDMMYTEPDFSADYDALKRRIYLNVRQ